MGADKIFEFKSGQIIHRGNFEELRKISKSFQKIYFRPKIMKICYISNSAAPSKNASSLQTSKLCEGLTKQGNNVLLILPNTGNSKKNYSFVHFNKSTIINKNQKKA